MDAFATAQPVVAQSESRGPMTGRRAEGFTFSGGFGFGLKQFQLKSKISAYFSVRETNNVTVHEIMPTFEDVNHDPTLTRVRIWADNSDVISLMKWWLPAS